MLGNHLIAQADSNSNYLHKNTSTELTVQINGTRSLEEYRNRWV